MAQLNEQLSSLTSCSICTETFSDPRMLPCIHTFCFRCLKQIETHSDKKPGDRIPCPICRTEFVIPQEGIERIQKNFFMKSLTDMIKIAKPKEVRPCGFCASEFEENSETASIPEAKVYCSECKEFICDECARHHKKQTPSRSHNIIQVGTGVIPTEVTSSSNCSRHNNEQIKLFCVDCASSLCLLCYVGSHRTHECKDISEVVNDCRKQMQQDVALISSIIPKAKERLDTLTETNKTVAAKFGGLENGFRFQEEKLRTLIRRHMSDALTELTGKKWRILKRLETHQGETESHYEMLQSFKSYCEEVLNKASSIDVCRYSRELHSRAIDLQKTHQSQFEAPVTPFHADIQKFDLEKALDLDKTNILGQLQDNYAAFMSGYPQCWKLTTLPKEGDQNKPFALHSDCTGCNELASFLKDEIFRSTRQTVTIEEIHCIQNVELYHKYLAKRESFRLNFSVKECWRLKETITTDGITSKTESVLKDMISRDLNERFLFYPVTSDNKNSICQTGFKMTKAGQKTANIFDAPGILFTDSVDFQNPMYTHGYRSYFVIVSRVLLGNSYPCEQQRQFKRLPCLYQGCYSDRCQHHGSSEAFDSVLWSDPLPGSAGQPLGLLAFKAPAASSGFRAKGQYNFVVCDSELTYPNFVVKVNLRD